MGALGTACAINTQLRPALAGVAGRRGLRRGRRNRWALTASYRRIPLLVCTSHTMYRASSPRYQESEARAHLPIKALCWALWGLTKPIPEPTTAGPIDARSVVPFSSRYASRVHRAGAVRPRKVAKKKSTANPPTAACRSEPRRLLQPPSRSWAATRSLSLTRQQGCNVMM